MNNSNILTTIQLKLLCTLRNRQKTKSQQSGSDLYLNGKPLSDNLMHPQPDAPTARFDLSGLSGKSGTLVIVSSSSVRQQYIVSSSGVRLQCISVRLLCIVSSSSIRLQCIVSSSGVLETEEATAQHTAAGGCFTVSRLMLKV